MTSNAVVVTGLGIVSSFGHTLEAFWEGVHAGPPVIDEEFGDSRVDYEGSKALLRDRKNLRRTDPSNAPVLLAAQQAADMAGNWEGIEPEGRSVFLGATLVALKPIAGAYMRHRNDEDFPSSTLPSVMCNGSVATVAISHRCEGPTLFVGAACASGNAAVHIAAQHIASGQSQAALAGGFEVIDREVSLPSLYGIGAASPTRRSRPFDEERDGVVPSEGATVLFLESESSAISRGAKILAYVSGSALTSDAYHHASPNPDGVRQSDCMAAAIRHANLAVGDISMIVSHGNGTPSNDSTESKAIARLLGDLSVPITTYKGATGHTWAASGAMNSAFAVLCMMHEEMPGIIGLATPALESKGLDLVTSDRPWTPGPALSNSFGFGGHNACVVLSPPF